MALNENAHARTFGLVSNKRSNTPLVHWVWALTVLGLWGQVQVAVWAPARAKGATTSTFRYNESAAITSLDPAAASLEHMWVVDQLYTAWWS